MFQQTFLMAAAFLVCFRFDVPVAVQCTMLECNLSVYLKQERLVWMSTVCACSKFTVLPTIETLRMLLASMRENYVYKHKKKSVCTCLTLTALRESSDPTQASVISL